MVSRAFSQPDGDAAIDLRLRFVRRRLASDHAEQGGLASAIGAEQTDFFAPEKRRPSLDIEQMVAILHAVVFKTYHAGPPSRGFKGP